MTTTETTLKLPPAIADLDLKFARALAIDVRQPWPEGEKYLAAEQPEAIAKILIHSDLHARLVNASICYLFRPEIVANGRAKGGVASKAGGKLAFLTGFDFTIELSHKVWLVLTDEQKIALLDHELAHCDRDLDAPAGGWCLRAHDVEEFSEVVARWGLWTPALKGFGVAIESAQIELFVPTLAAAAEEPAPRDQAEAERARIKRGGK